MAWRRSVGRARRRAPTSDQRPAASGGPERRQPAGPRGARSRAGPLPAQRPERRERVVRDLARPDEVPQRVEDLAVRAAAGRARTARGRTRRRARPGARGSHRAAVPMGGPCRRRDRPAGPARGRAGPARSGRRRGRGCRGRPRPPRRGRRARRAGAAGSPGPAPAGCRARGPRRAGPRPASWSTTSASRSRAACWRSGAGASPAAADALPGRQEPGEGGRVDGLDLAPEPGQRAAPEQAQDIRVDPLALGAARAGTRRAGSCRPRGAGRAHRRRRRPAVPSAAPARGQERPVGPGAPGEQAVEGAAGRPEEGVRDAGRRRDTRRRRGSARRPRSRSSARRRRSGPRPPGAMRSARSSHASLTVAPPSQRAATSSADRSPRRRRRSWSWSAVDRPAILGQGLERRARGRRAPRGRAARGAPPGRAARGGGRGRGSGRPARRSASGASPSYM